MRLNVERLLWPGVFALFGLAATTGWFTYSTVHSLDGHREQVGHASDTLHALEDTIFAMEGIETGQRGFIITGDTDFLEPRTSGLARLEPALAELQKHVSGAAEQEADLTVLRPLITERVAFADRTIAMSEGGDREGAMALIATEQGKRAMDSIRAIVARMESRERANLERAGRASDDAARRLWVVTAALGVLSLALIVVLALGARASLFTQHRLAERRRLLSGIVNSSSDAIMSLDREGLITTWNPAAELIFGYPAAEVLGRPVTLIVPDDRRVELAANLEKVRAGETITGQETVRLARDGHPVDVSLSVFPVSGAADGTVTAAIMRDIGEKKAAEQALRESEERFATVVRRSPIPIIVEFGSNILLDVNDAFTALTAFERDEVIGRNTHELGFWADPEDRQQIVSALANTGAVNNYPLQLRMRSGETRDALVSAERIDSAGRPLVIAQFVDVTERNRLQEDLDRIFALSPEFMCVAGLDGYFKRINPTFESALGYTHEELLACPFLDFVHHDDIASTMAEVEKLGTGAVTISFTNRYRCKDGSYRWLSWNSVPVVEEGLIFAVARDITGERATQDALREVQERLQAIMDNSPAAIYVKDLEGRYVLVNDHVAELHRRPAADLVGKTVFDLFPPEVASALADHDQRVLASNAPLEWEETAPLADGEHVFLSNKFPLVGPDGRPRYLCGISTEITSRKRAEEALAEASAAADAANQAKSEFLSRMSHELRTPLNVVLGFAQVLEMDPLTEGQTEAVHHILNSGRQLLTLIDEVLDISRIESGRVALSLEPVDLHELVSEAVAMLQPLATERRINLALPAEGESHHALADRQRTRQVLLNLLSNAIKYNREGGTVTVSCAPADGGIIRISVADTGPGMTPEKLTRMFTPFDRLGAEATTVTGTGLGLALSKRLVEAMHGQIGVESQPGEGSTFWVDLPASEELRSGRAAAALRPAPRRTSAGARTVLCIEDNLSNFKLIERVLARYEGLTLLPATQGSMGLDLARQHHPDLVLLDLHLPDLPGREVLRALKEDPATRDIPVIIASADATPGQIARLIDAGAVDYLTKPLDIHELLAAVDAVFGIEPGAST